MAQILEGNYDPEFILNNPIPAVCEKCQRKFVDGEIISIFDGYEIKEIICNEAIRAPQLENCRCFYCGGKLLPIDSEAYLHRQAELPKHFIASDGKIYQPPLF